MGQHQSSLKPPTGPGHSLKRYTVSPAITRTEAFPLEADPNLTLNGYSLLLKLGAGAYGRVVLVRQKSTQKFYALKYVDKRSTPQILKTIVEEREILEKVRHPFICNLKYAFQEQGFFCLILELACATDLRHQIEKFRFSEEIIKVWIAEIACALGYLHRKSIVHRDIKPENILMSAQGHVKLADFNVARELTPERPELCGISGTFNYMAPEVHELKNYAEKVDWWALGVVFYECIYRVIPFKVDSRQHIVDRMKEGLMFPLANPDVSYHCKDVILKLLERNPSRRISSPETLFNTVFFRSIDRRRLEHISENNCEFIVSSNTDVHTLGSQPSATESIFEEICTLTPFSKHELRAEFDAWVKKRKNAFESQEKRRKQAFKERKKRKQELNGVDPNDIVNESEVSSLVELRHIYEPYKYVTLRSHRNRRIPTEMITNEGVKEYRMPARHVRQFEPRTSIHTSIYKRRENVSDALQGFTIKIQGILHSSSRLRGNAQKHPKPKRYFPRNDNMERAFLGALPCMNKRSPSYCQKMTVLKTKFELQELFEPFDHSFARDEKSSLYSATHSSTSYVSVPSFTIVQHSSSGNQSDRSSNFSESPDPICSEDGHETTEVYLSRDFLLSDIR